MRQTERAEFVELLRAVFALYRAEFSEAVLGIWWGAMDSFSLDEVREALSRHAMDADAGMFLPKPADVVRQLGGTTQDRAALAWARVVRAISDVGHWESVEFGDPIIHRVVADMGGWEALCATLDKELPFAERRFRDAYRAWLRHGLPPGDEPAHLPGRFEAVNGAHGFIESPRRIEESVSDAKMRREALRVLGPVREVE